ncbi:MAG: phosphoglycerate dehydrogenase, partial [Planctomycetota bacterium]
VSTAEHAFALMLALSRNIAPANQGLIEGRWDRKKYMGKQLAGKTLGIVGMGRIGREVAQRAQAFKMDIVACDPYLTDEQAKTLNVCRCESVEQLLPSADYLTVHTPKTERPIFRKEHLPITKKGLRLVNAARGGVYEIEALIEGLQSGVLGGVALDVYEEEPCTDSPLFGMEGVVCTPHLGASTEEAQTQVAVEGIQLLLQFFATGEIKHAVNVAALDPQTLEALRGYMNIGYRLGLLLSQWHDGGIDQIKLTFRGQISDKDTRVLSSSFCAGLAKNVMDTDVNIINAEVLLKDRGIQISEEKYHELGAFSSSITATVSGNGSTRTAGGTMLGHDMPRLVVLNEHRLEAYLDGTLLIFSHRDVPGLIGSVGTLLGEKGVNIAQMSVGRGGEAGGEAIGVLNLDSVPSAEAMQAIADLEAIVEAKFIELPAAGTSFTD